MSIWLASFSCSLGRYSRISVNYDSPILITLFKPYIPISAG